MTAKIFIPVKYIGEGLFSSQRVVELTDYQRKTFQGLFDEVHMSGNSLLKVQVMSENEKLVALTVPHGEHCGLYGHGEDAGRNITIERSRLVYMN